MMNDSVWSTPVFGLSYALAYDALGRCVKRTLNAGDIPGATTYYIYDGEKPIAEFSGTGNPLVAYNIYGKGIDEILERVCLTGGQWKAYCFQQDYQGSVTHLTDASTGPTSGNMLELYRYDAFGAPSIWGHLSRTSLSSPGAPGATGSCSLDASSRL